MLQNYVILQSFLQAAYCIAKSCRMVLCIQNLSKDNCTVHGEKVYNLLH